MSKTDSEIAHKLTFEEAAKPLIKWLVENVNPHSTAVVDCTGAVLYSAEKSFQTEEYLKD